MFTLNTIHLSRVSSINVQKRSKVLRRDLSIWCGASVWQQRVLAVVAQFLCYGAALWEFKNMNLGKEDMSSQPIRPMTCQWRDQWVEYKNNIYKNQSLHVAMRLKGFGGSFSHTSQEWLVFKHPFGQMSSSKFDPHRKRGLQLKFVAWIAFGVSAALGRNQGWQA